MKKFLIMTAAAFIVMPVPSAMALGINCAKPKDPLVRMICQDQDLNSLENEMIAAFEEAQSQAHGEPLLPLQRLWFARRKEKCEVVSEQDIHNNAKRQCVEKDTIIHILSLKSLAERGRVKIIDQSPETQAACNTLLVRENIAWEGRSDAGHDSFSVGIPASVQTPTWSWVGPNVMKAKFDFLNNGQERTVYSISVDTSHYNYQWFVVVEPAEEQIIAQRLQEAVKSRGDFESLIGSLSADLEHQPVGQSRDIPTANASSLPRNPKIALKSRLFDTSNTPIYEGWYTHSSVVLSGGKTLLVAESHNDMGGPTASIFTPTAAGNLDLACFYNAFPSRIKKVATLLQDQYPCPSTLPELPIPWDKPYTTLQQAIVTLKEWGGARPVREKCLLSGPSRCYTITDVGPIGAETVSDDDSLNWDVTRKLKAEAEDISLRLTPAGPYLMASDKGAEKEDEDDKSKSEAPTIYLKILPNGELIRACSVVDEVVPPPGYEPH